MFIQPKIASPKVLSRGVKQNPGSQALQNLGSTFAVPNQLQVHFGLTQTSSTDELSSDEILRRYPFVRALTEATIQIERNGGRATAFFIEGPDNLPPQLLTVNHVTKFQESDDELAQPFDGYYIDPASGHRLSKISLEIVPALISHFHDVLILNAVSLPPSLRRVPRLKLRDLEKEPLEVGEPVFMLGRSSLQPSQRLEHVFLPGKVTCVSARYHDYSRNEPSGSKAKYFESDINTLPGDSGSPVVDAKGRLIGIQAVEGGWHIHGKSIARVLRVQRGD